MRVTLVCIDKPGAQQTRADNRAAHLAHIQSTGVVEMAGPFLNPEGQMVGSLIVLDVESLGKAQEWSANDPYAKADLFQSVFISEWKKVVG